MIETSTATFIAALSVIALMFCLGGCAGLYLAWTQEFRMDRWAARAVRLAELQEAVKDAYARGGEPREVVAPAPDVLPGL